MERLDDINKILDSVKIKNIKSDKLLNSILNETKNRKQKVSFINRLTSFFDFNINAFKVVALQTCCFVIIATCGFLVSYFNQNASSYNEINDKIEISYLFWE